MEMALVDASTEEGLALGSEANSLVIGRNPCIAPRDRHSIAS
jgi:hypothetical protein